MYENLITEQELNKNIENFKIEKNKALREIFKKFMKPNLLICLKEEILHSDEFKNIIRLNCFKLTPSMIIGIGADDPEYEICLDLTMIYWYLTLFDNDEEKSKKHKDEKFIENLKVRTLFQCRLRPLNRYFNKTNYFIEHTPIHYAVSCMVNFMLSNIDARVQSGKRLGITNENFKINTMVVILKTIKSILLLVESDNAGSAFSLLRSVIEMDCVYFAIEDNENVAQEYYKFMRYRMDFENTGKYPAEFMKIVPKNIHWQNYLNYGWLDQLANRKSKDTQLKYIFNELLNNIKFSDERNKELFSVVYKYCCKFSHGNYLNQSIDPYVFIWILSRIGIILKDLAQEFSQMFNVKLEYNNIDLFEFLNKATVEAFQIYEKQS